MPIISLTGVRSGHDIRICPSTIAGVRNPVFAWYHRIPKKLTLQRAFESSNIDLSTACTDPSSTRILTQLLRIFNKNWQDSPLECL